MKDKLLILPICLIAMVLLLAGCRGGESGSSFLGFGDGLVGDGLAGGLAGGSDNAGNLGNAGSGSTETPEPATMALLGSGLFAYALFRRKRKK